mgnify:CR=1 FL=1
MPTILYKESSPILREVHYSPRIVIVRQKKSDFKFLSSRFPESVRFLLSGVDDRISRNPIELQQQRTAPTAHCTHSELHPQRTAENFIKRNELLFRRIRAEISPEAPNSTFKEDSSGGIPQLHLECSLAADLHYFSFLFLLIPSYFFLFLLISSYFFAEGINQV